MITIEQIHQWAKPHPVGKKAKIVRLSNEDVLISIVGGDQGVYGDFENDFEIAIMDTDTKNFVTRHFFTELNDDVKAYASIEEVVRIVNMLMKKNFQVL